MREARINPTRETDLSHRDLEEHISSPLNPKKFARNPNDVAITGSSRGCGGEVGAHEILQGRRVIDVRRSLFLN